MIGVRPIPPNDFCRKLYRFDPDLRITWDDVMSCWQIWHMDKKDGSINHVMNVIENDGSYRQLDDRVFLILTKNRWYAQHPEALEADVVDSFLDKRDEDQKRVHDDLKHLSKDSALKKRFEAMREKLSTIDMNEWTKPRQLYDACGKPIVSENGEKVIYIPHQSLLS